MPTLRRIGADNHQATVNESGTMLLIAIALMLVPVLTFGAPAKKWAPGHYIETETLSPKDLRIAGVRGVLVRYQWSTLEHGGVVDLSRVRADMALAKSAGRDFGLILEDKDWGVTAGARCVPDDIKDGQSLELNSFGKLTCRAKTWTRPVSDRWVNFIKTVGRELDDSDVVMVQNTESATASGVPAADYLSHLQREARAFAAAWPTTPWAMSLNWTPFRPDDRTELVKLIASLGGGITHPDSVPPLGQPNHYDPLFKAFAGKLVLAPLSENTFLDGAKTLIGQPQCGGKVCTWTDVAKFVTGYLGAHYAGWQRYAWGEVPFQFDRDMAPVLLANPTNKACPANISCR